MGRIPGIAYIPEYLRDKTLCELAMDFNYWSYLYVPDELKTAKMTDTFAQKYFSENDKYFFTGAGLRGGTHYIPVYRDPYGFIYNDLLYMR